jgi:two-component system cell cycle sensor histidine kinase/response regulator CckA
VKTEGAAVPEKTILVVDDDSDVLKLVGLILTTKGYEVITATSADQALRKARNLDGPPDLLLTDVVMPGLSGPMLADRLSEVHPTLRVLFMSGYDDRQVVRRYIKEKGFALIPKPFTADQLSEKVENLLQAAPPGGGQPPSGDGGSQQTI